MKRVLVIVNPVAGGGQARQVAAELRDWLQARGWSVRLEATEFHGHATALAATHGRAVARVIVVGGDGTLRETVVGLDGEGPPVGLVPVGNANVVARELGIPRQPRAAIRALAACGPRPIDVGRAGDTLFLAMVGIGYDGWTVAGVGWMRSTRWGGLLYRYGGGALAYGLAGVPALFRLIPGKVRVICDGVALSRQYPSVIVANTATYALGWAMTPGARADDGRLDHQANRRTAPWFVLWTLTAAMLRRRLPGFIAEYGRGARYRILADRPFRWQMDGDPMPPVRELDIEVVPRFVQVLVPGAPVPSAAGGRA